MKTTTRRIIVTNILIAIIIIIVYLLTFNSKVETAITGVYSEAKYKGIKNTKNSVGMLCMIDEDFDMVFKLAELSKKHDIEVSYMLSADLIVQNKEEISALILEGKEIGIANIDNKDFFKALRILNEASNKNILYVQKKRDLNKDIFSNDITVVVYSINVNTAHEKDGADLGDYLSEGDFILFEASKIESFEPIVEAIKSYGYKIQKVGDMI